jgi:hypothetical protein
MESARVVVTGSSGLVGRALVSSLEAAGHAVTRLVRRSPASEGEVRWDPSTQTVDLQGLEGVDAVVHLAGESLAAGRWTAERKKRLRSSRVDATRFLSENLAQVASPPRVLISASAVGYYGNRGDERLTETSGPGRGFLAELAQAWEAATAAASARGIRVVWLRTAIVLSPSGGALARLIPIFRLGLGGPLADGRSWWSWIAIDDLIEIIRFVLDRDDLTGPVNAASPEPVRNETFTRVLATALRRPAFFRVPSLVLRLAFGEMADEMLLTSTRIEPAVLREAGFRFRFPELGAMLRQAIGSRP